MKISAVSEDCFLIQVTDKIDVALVDHIAYWVSEIEKQLGEHLVDIIPSYTTILVHYNLLTTSPLLVEQRLQEIVAQSADNKTGAQKSKLIELPVFYHSSVAWDLNTISKKTGLSTNDIISLHSQCEYRVCAVGFTPGFAFLAEVPSQICIPRHATPRKRVPAGSVAIADSQTAVYPADSPGGWQIIGNCPIALFDCRSELISPFSVGDRVKFNAISEQQFLRLGGVIEHE